MNPKLLQRAVDLSFALYNPEGENRCSHYSFLYYKGRIIAIGQNSKKTDPTNLKNPRIGRDGVNLSSLKGQCSELNVFKKFRNLTQISFNKVEMVNTRIDRNKKLTIAAPCSACQNLLLYMNPRAVYYTDKEGSFKQYI